MKRNITILKRTAFSFKMESVGNVSRDALQGQSQKMAMIRINAENIFDPPNSKQNALNMGLKILPLHVVYVKQEFPANLKSQGLIS